MQVFNVVLPFTNCNSVLPFKVRSQGINPGSPLPSKDQSALGKPLCALWCSCWPLLQLGLILECLLQGVIHLSPQLQLMLTKRFRALGVLHINDCLAPEIISLLLFLSLGRPHMSPLLWCEGQHLYIFLNITYSRARKFSVGVTFSFLMTLLNIDTIFLSTPPNTAEGLLWLPLGSWPQYQMDSPFLFFWGDWMVTLWLWT